MIKRSSHTSVPWWRHALIATCTAVCTLSGAGCNLSDTGPTAYRSPDKFFAVLALEHHAINLSMVAPYDTVTLHTIRAMGDGSVVPGEVIYSVSNPSISVTDGVLKAERPVDSAVVRVTLVYGTIKRTDSAIVSVRASAPDHLRDFGLRLAAGDSAKTSTNVTKTIPILRASESGSNLSTLRVSITSSDTNIVSLTRTGGDVSIKAKRPGRVALVSSTFAFGTAWRDSLVFTVGWPISFFLPTTESFRIGSETPVLAFAYPELTIGVGGCVGWINTNLEVDLDVQFDDPSHATAPGGAVCPVLFQLLSPDVGGNIEPFHRIPISDEEVLTEEDLENYIKAWLSPYRARVFSTPGIYLYRSTLHGTTGRIRVCDERNDTTCAPARLGGWY